MTVTNIIPIIENRLYSVVFDDAPCGIFEFLIEQWSDVNYLVNYFAKHEEFTQNPFWERLYKNKPERAADAVIQDIYALEDYLYELSENADNQTTPDLDEYFEALGGKYKYVTKYIPMKGYGMHGHLSFIRFYAIKMPDDENCYVIVYGGLKLKKPIQDSPVLRDEVFRRIDATMQFMKDNGLIDSDGLNAE